MKKTPSIDRTTPGHLSNAAWIIAIILLFLQFSLAPDAKAAPGDDCTFTGICGPGEICEDTGLDLGNGLTVHICVADSNPPQPPQWEGSIDAVVLNDSRVRLNLDPPSSGSASCATIPTSIQWSGASTGSATFPAGQNPVLVINEGGVYNFSADWCIEIAPGEIDTISGDSNNPVNLAGLPPADPPASVSHATETLFEVPLAQSVNWLSVSKLPKSEVPQTFIPGGFEQPVASLPGFRSVYLVEHADYYPLSPRYGRTCFPIFYYDDPHSVDVYYMPKVGASFSDTPPDTRPRKLKTTHGVVDDQHVCTHGPIGGFYVLYSETPPPNDEQQIIDLVTALFGRAPSESEVANLHSYPEHERRSLIAYSAEMRGLINQVYIDFLNRSATSIELDAAVALIAYDGWNLSELETHVAALAGFGFQAWWVAVIF